MEETQSPLAPMSFSQAMTQEAVLAWQGILQATPPHVRSAVQRSVEAHGEALATEFYEHLLSSARSGQFLDNELIQNRLRHSMRHWLIELFSVSMPDELPAAVDRQIAIGAMHARIRLPIDLIPMGVRVLKRSVRRDLAQSALTAPESVLAQLFVSDLLHLADGLMSQAYFHDVQLMAHRDEAYKAITQRRSASYERTRQRAALSEWAEEVFMSGWAHGQARMPSHLRDSEFGVWLHHKGVVLFGDSPEMGALIESIDLMDSTLLPRLMEGVHDRQRASASMVAIKALLDLIRMQLSDLFEHILSHDDGFDEETHLPDRRFVPVVLSTEMVKHTQGHLNCGLLMIEIGTPTLNAMDSTGSRQRLMEKAANILQRQIRSCDHLFRYDDNRFLLLAVESPDSRVRALAEGLHAELRNAIQAANVQGSWTPVPTDVAIGVALYDHHPDYRYFVQRAEAALAQARSKSPALQALA